MKLRTEKFIVIASFILSALSLGVSIVCAINYPDDIECSASYEAGLSLTDEQL